VPQWLENAHNSVVLATVGSVVVSTLVGLSYLSPVLHAAAILPFYYGAMRQQLHHFTVALIFRWGLTLFCSVLVVGAFAPARMASSTIAGRDIGPQLQGWLTGPGGPPADFPYLLWGILAFLVGSAISAGLFGFILGATAIGTAAVGALVLFEHGSNVVSIGLTAVPIWQWVLFVAAGLLLVPTALPVFDRVFKQERVAEEKEALRRLMIAGGAGFLLSLLLRLATAGLWHSLLRDLTTF
jgi:hypothetical protein